MTSRVIAVAGTSHSPMVTLDPGLIWPARALTDVTNPGLYDTSGVVRTYDEHVAAAAGKFDKELDRSVWAAKHALAIESIERLGHDVLARGPDLIIPVGDDQKEMYDFDNFPALSLYYGDEVTIVPPPSREPTLPHEREVRLMQGLDGSTHPGDAAAGRQLIQELVAREFDVAGANKIRDHGPHQGFGHAIAFVLVRLLKSSGIPCVPVLLNTYFPPNQPSPKRCVDLGRAIAAGAGGAEDLKHQWSEYIPAYRSPAGTGIGLAFGLWA